MTSIVQTAQGSAGSGSALVVVLPAPPTPGNVVALVTARRGTTGSMGLPAGFTPTGVDEDTWGGGMLSIAYRVVQSGDSATLTFTNTGSTTKVGYAYEIAGLDAAALLDLDAFFTNSSTAITLTAGEATDLADEFIIAATASRGGAGVALDYSYSAGWTDDGTVASGSGTTAGVYLSIAHRITTATETPSYVATRSDGAANNQGAGLAAFRVDGGGGPPPTEEWSEWNGSAEEALTLDGEWNGSTVVPLSYDSVTT